MEFSLCTLTPEAQCLTFPSKSIGLADENNKSFNGMEMIRKTVLFFACFYWNMFFSKWVKIWSDDETPIYKKNLSINPVLPRDHIPGLISQSKYRVSKISHSCWILRNYYMIFSMSVLVSARDPHIKSNLFWRISSAIFNMGAEYVIMRVISPGEMELHPVIWPSKCCNTRECRSSCPGF